ncbi:unnamed protein product, partial [Bubo scandiacus]
MVLECFSQEKNELDGLLGPIRPTPARKEMDQHCPHHCQHHLQRLLPPEWEQSLPAEIQD